MKIKQTVTHRVPHPILPPPVKQQQSAVLLILFSVLVFCAPCLSPLQARGQTGTGESRLWYREPAPIWNEALPIGNGRVGAMIFGGANDGSNNGDQQDPKENKDILDRSKTHAQDEHLQLNEGTLWSGSRADRLNPNGGEGFKQARALLLEAHGTDAAKIAQAEAIAQQSMIAIPRGMPPYSTLGDLYLKTGDTAAVAEYVRELNLRTGVARVSYTRAGVHFVREMFASAPDQLIVLHVTADKPGSISFKVTMDRPGDFAISTLGDRDLVLTEGPNHKDEIRFRAQVRVLARGGRISPTDRAIAVESADEVTLLIAAGTDFKGGPFAGGSPSRLCTGTLDTAEKKSYAQLRDSAIQDQQRWMDRVSFQLGTPDPAQQALPTNERVRRVAAGADDLGLQTLYFQFARYLLLGSSRPGGLPANLQGLWASGINNPWGSKWTVDVNTEMNYWMAESANLSETHLPLFDLLDMVRTPGTGTGQTVAQRYYGARGFVLHHNTDIWGDAEPIDGYPYGIWPMGGAWLTLHAWDHYAYTGDLAFLRQRAWPLLHDASLFYLDYLVDDGTGHLVTGPSLSPENKYKLPDGSSHSLTMAPTMDIEILREIFQRTIQASELLGIEPAFREQVRAAMSQLPPFRIGGVGQLQEWQQDYQESAAGHRHISHLWALYPGTQINPQHTPELSKAARVTLQRRLDHGGGQTGWSRAWVVNYWDRLKEGDKAYESLQIMFRQSTFPNMMDTHPPGVFQIDGNLGAANGMLEALVQSFWYPDHVEIELLPALPRVWEKGSISGIRVRGGAELAMQWSDRRLVSVTWRALQGGDFDLRIPSGQHLSSITSAGKSLTPAVGKDGPVRVRFEKGNTYTLSLK